MNDNQPSRKIRIWLKKEVEKWTSEGIVPAGSGDKIRERYLLDDIGLKDRSSKSITALAIIGALLLGAGTILLIASNWEAVPKWGKLSFIFIVILAVNHLGYSLRYTKGNYPRVGMALLFLGTLLFGGGIWLVAQIFQITSRFHSGILFWALGILPVAWFLRSGTVLTTASFLLSLWVMVRIQDFRTPNYIFLIPMFLLIIPLCYRIQRKVPLFVSVTGIVAWFIYGHMLSFPREPIFLYTTLATVTLGVFLYSSGILQSRFTLTSPFAWIYLFIGSVVTYLSLYVLSFRGILPHFWRAGTAPTRAHMFTVFGVLAVLSLVQIASAFLYRGRESAGFDKTSLVELILLGVMIAYSTLAMFVPKGSFHGILSNVLMLSLSIGLIYLGYYREQVLFVNTGVVLFGVHFTTRFIDWGWRYLPRSLFFLLAGVIVILGAFFMEKQRKRLIGGIKEEKGV